jgi:hypothetical protein
MMRACLGFIAICIAAPALAQTTVERSGDAIVFNGRIDEPSADRFLALLKEGGIRRLVIDSPGGQVLSALSMAEAVHGDALDIEVPSTCRSSCANYVFVAGRRKTAGRPGAVAWHGNMHHILCLERTGQGRWSEALMEGARELVRQEQAFYARVGVDGFIAWFGKLPPYDAPDFYSIPPAAMRRFGVGDVTVQPGPADPDVQLLDLSSDELARLRPPG